jgi:HK97 gp10 family phage protein
MADFFVDVSGIVELNKKLRELAGDKIAKKVLLSAIRKAAKPMVAAAKAFAPVDSGLLEESIKLKAIRRTRTGFGVRISTSNSDFDSQGSTFYGPMQEFGTAKMAPNPYLRPAFDTTKDQSVQIVTADMQAAIAEATR